MTDATPAAPATRPARPTADPDSPFHRAGGRNRFTARRARVVEVTDVAPVMRRVRVSGPEFADFVSGGPSDHVKVFFPDPVTGELNAPSPVGPGEDGIVRPDAPMLPRDFTPLHIVKHDDGGSIDLDFYLHASPGPAAQWAASAKPGDDLVVVGPRGSKAAPQNAARVIVVADETALPSATRWAAEVPASTRVDVIAVTADDGGWVADYIASTSGRTDVIVHPFAAGSDGDALVALIDQVGVDAGTYVFAAGEASALIPVRRHLRTALSLPREQFAISGYWKQGAVAFDHHAPIDPDDPED